MIEEWIGQIFPENSNYTQWLIFLGLVVAGLVVEKIARLYLIKVVTGLLVKGGASAPPKLKEQLLIPTRIFTVALLWNVGVPLLRPEWAVAEWSTRTGRVLIVLGILVAVYQAVDFFFLYFQRKAERSENKFDDILVPLIRKSVKTFVIAIGIITIGDSLTLDIKGILAGMGIIGLGLSLAAKDTLSNLFGSLTVLLDRPFRIGDWVVIDGNIEGIVEEVGLRSCRVRTFYNSLITLPNGCLTNAPIDNFGRRSYRRLSTVLSVQYDTPPQKIEAFCEGVRQIIREHPHTRKDYFHVYLSEMAASGLNIMLYVFFQTPSWAQELQERHRLLMDILQLAAEMGVQFAFPTQTLHVVEGKDTAYDGMPKSFEEVNAYARGRADKVLRNHSHPNEKL